MSFYTSLTGLNAATAMLGVTSNNISNVGTTGFKRSRADFGDIFATSPLQKASSTVGQGVSLKQVSQEFSQGNISFSSNALDLAVTGDGFFPMRSADGLQELFTRNGSFLLNEQFNVVNSSGQRLMAATVDSTGSANINERVVLTIPPKNIGRCQANFFGVFGFELPSRRGSHYRHLQPQQPLNVQQVNRLHGVRQRWQRLFGHHLLRQNSQCQPGCAVQQMANTRVRGRRPSGRFIGSGHRCQQ
jgi:flagellar hook protein FlgE